MQMARYALLAGLLAALVSETSLSDPLDDRLRPLPSLGPAEVVRIQLEALRHNDADDRGIEVAFRFASPANKLNTGPLPRFVAMIENGPYALMLRFDSASYEPVEIDGRRAAQRVTLVAPGRVMSYVFYLSRQDGDGPYDDCWMTDAVVVVPFRGGEA